jgi:hypothetical protein
VKAISLPLSLKISVGSGLYFLMKTVTLPSIDLPLDLWSHKWVGAFFNVTG